MNVGSAHLCPALTSHEVCINANRSNLDLQRKVLPSEGSGPFTHHRLLTVFSLSFGIVSVFGDSATHFKVTSTQIFSKQGVLGSPVVPRNFMSSLVLCKG